MKFFYAIAAILLCLFSSNLFPQKADTLFSNSLFYNSIYDDNSFIDSTAIANLYNNMLKSSGEEKVEYLFKLINGFYFYKPHLSQEFGDQALKISQKIGNDSLIAFSYHYTGIAYNYLGFKRTALNYYSKGLKTEFAKTHENYQSWVTFNSGIMYFELDEPDSAAKYYYKAIKLNETVGNQAFASKVYKELTRLYLSTGNFDESLLNYREAIKRINLDKDKRVAAQLFEQRFKIAFGKNEIDSANMYFTYALNKGIELNDSSLISEIYYNHGNQQFDKKLYTASLSTFKNGLKFVNKSNYPTEYYSFIHAIGKSNLYLNNINLAKDQIYKAIEGFKHLSDKELLSQFELTLARLHAKTGNWGKYIYHQNRSDSIRAINLRIKELAAINEYKTIYETEKKDQQIKYQILEIASQKRQIIFISGISILILLLLFITLNFSKKVKIRNKELYNQNLELTKRWNELQGFYLKCTPPEDETKESKTLFQKIIKLFNDEKTYRQSDLTVDYLAKTFSSNIKYISSAIKDQTGMNFNTFVNTYRIEDSKRMLQSPETSNLTLEAIAEECGFNNPTSFYLAFKKNTGLTPTQYRNFKAA